MVKRKVRGMCRDIVLQTSTLPEMEEKIIAFQDAMDCMSNEMSWESQIGEFNMEFWEKESHKLDNKWDSNYKGE